MVTPIQNVDVELCGIGERMESQGQFIAHTMSDGPNVNEIQFAVY